MPGVRIWEGGERKGKDLVKEWDIGRGRLKTHIGVAMPKEAMPEGKQTFIAQHDSRKKDEEGTQR